DRRQHARAKSATFSGNNGFLDGHAPRIAPGAADNGIRIMTVVMLKGFSATARTVGHLSQRACLTRRPPSSLCIAGTSLHALPLPPRTQYRHILGVTHALLDLYPRAATSWDPRCPAAVAAGISCLTKRCADLSLHRRRRIFSRRPTTVSQPSCPFFLTPLPPAALAIALTVAVHSPGPRATTIRWRSRRIGGFPPWPPAHDLSPNPPAPSFRRRRLPRSPSLPPPLCPRPNMRMSHPRDNGAPLTQIFVVFAESSAARFRTMPSKGRRVAARLSLGASPEVHGAEIARRHRCRRRPTSGGPIWA
ncbi:hypothetical protein GGX14DRAFT_483191, partial [Mycena pura]